MPFGVNLNGNQFFLTMLKTFWAQSSLLGQSCIQRGFEKGEYGAYLL